MSTQALPAPGLTEAQVQQFWEDGFISGIHILTEEQAAIARRRFEVQEGKAAQSAGAQWTDDAHAPWNESACPLRAWFHAMSTHPRILAALSSLLGPNLLIRNGDVFIKKPENVRRISWHVDTTAPLEEARLMMTSWLALSESTEANGCMQFIRGSHRRALPERNKDKYSLSLQGDDLERVKALPTVSNLLRPGQLSIHCFRTLHRSGGNHTPLRRFGYVTRFLAPGVNPTASECGHAFLAQGENEPAHLQLRSHFPVSWQRSSKTVTY